MKHLSGPPQGPLTSVHAILQVLPIWLTITVSRKVAPFPHVEMFPSRAKEQRAQTARRKKVTPLALERLPQLSQTMWDSGKPKPHTSCWRLPSPAAQRSGLPLGTAIPPPLFLPYLCNTSSSIASNAKPQHCRGSNSPETNLIHRGNLEYPDDPLGTV